MHKEDGRDEIRRKESNERVDAAMNELKCHRLKWVCAFQLREVQHLPRKVVAEILELPRVQTVNDRVRLAKEYLQSQLPPKEDLL